MGEVLLYMQKEKEMYMRNNFSETLHRGFRRNNTQSIHGEEYIQ